MNIRFFFFWRGRGGGWDKGEVKAIQTYVKNFTLYFLCQLLRVGLGRSMKYISSHGVMEMLRSRSEARSSGDHPVTDTKDHAA